MQNKSEITSRNVGRFCWKLKFLYIKRIYIYYFAGNPVSGNIIGRISGQILIRYNPRIDVTIENSDADDAFERELKKELKRDTESEISDFQVQSLIYLLSQSKNNMTDSLYL